VSAPKYTPGPWKVGSVLRSQNKAVYVPVYADDGRNAKRLSTISVYTYNRKGEAVGDFKTEYGERRVQPSISEAEMSANATLIAAAPELARVGRRLYMAVQALAARSLMDANANARNMREAADAVNEWREIAEKAGIE
jgi:hypothetical protein